MTTYSQLIPFLSANGGTTIISWDISNGVEGTTPDMVAVRLNADLTVLPRPPGAPGIPGLVGAAAPGEIAGLILAANSTVRFFQPQSAAVLAAGFGTIESA